MNNNAENIVSEYVYLIENFPFDHFNYYYYYYFSFHSVRYNCHCHFGQDLIFFQFFFREIVNLFRCHLFFFNIIIVFFVSLFKFYFRILFFLFCCFVRKLYYLLNHIRIQIYLGGV